MTEQDFSHTSVLLKETIDFLVTDTSGVYLDCTLGGAGHSLGIAGRLAKGGRLIGLDRDDDALRAAKERLRTVSCRVDVLKSNFSRLDEALAGLGVQKVSGILFDLGVSSYQLDTAERGFSYMRDGALDMRMDKEGELTAFTVVNYYQEKRLSEIIRKYGEERWAERIACFIVREREKKPIHTTAQLAGVIKMAIPKGARKDGPHPAKRTFQAIRIEVNDELGILEKAFAAAVDKLLTNGRLAIITFHSLEDRIAKQALARFAKGCECPPKLPVCVCGKRPLLRVVKAVTPQEKEIGENPRARSARLRAAIKI